MTRSLIKPVGRLIALATIVTLVSTCPLSAQTKGEPGDVPPSEPRRLTREESSKIAKLNRQIASLNEAGRFAESIAPLRELLEIRTRLQGRRHPLTEDAGRRLEHQRKLASLPAEAQRALGSAFSEERQAVTLDDKRAYPEAERIHRAAIETLVRWLGEDSPETAIAYGNLALNLTRQQRHSEAQPLHRKVLDLWRRALGEEHPQTALAYNKLAQSLLYQGRYVEAGPLFQRALDIDRKVWGEDHPDTARAYNNLAMNLEHLGRYAEAEPLLRKALDLTRKVRGANHPDTASSYNNLAANLRDQGRYAEAQPFFQRALDGYRNALGEEHPETARSYNNLACNLMSQGQNAEALSLQKRALDIWREVRGEEHTDTARAYHNLADALSQQHRYAESLALLQKALDIWRKVLGEEHPDTALAYMSLANALGHLDRYAEALPFHQKALEILRKVLGEDHPDTALSYSSLALNLCWQERYAEALPLLQKALDIRRKVLGEDHPAVANGYHNLACALYELGRIPEAITNWTNASRNLERGRQALSSSGLERSQAGLIAPLTGLTVALAAQGQAQEAWRRWESSLGRGLLDDISSRRLRPLTSAQRAQEDNLLGQIRRLDEQIVVLAQSRGSSVPNVVRMEHLRQQRGTVQGQLLELEQTFESQYGAFAGERASLEEIQAALPPDAALVGWVDANRTNRSAPWHWGCLMGAHGDPVWVRIPGSGPGGTGTDQDDRRPDQLRTALLGRDPGWRKLAAQVARQRLEPLKPQLGRLHRLIVLPSPYLMGIPLEVLLEAWTDGPRLVVSYAPSGTMFAQLAKASASPSGAGKLLAVGDPLYVSPSVNQALAPRSFEGVQITQVEYPQGRRGGLEPGDVLLTYDGREITNSERFREVLEEVKARRKTAQLPRPFKPGVTVSRNGKAHSFVLDPQFTRITFRGWRQTARPTMPTPAPPPLPGTRLEVRSIAALFPKEQTTTLLGAGATETAVQRLASSGELARYRFVHFATHGEVNPDVAMSSALILAPDQSKPANPSATPSDGRITAEQILNTWNLDADLVVLSACETGRGKLADVEGYLGFAQALFIRGARSLVLSQWSVNDDATALLMSRFYQNLLGKRPGLSKPMPKAEALDEAKRWLRNLTQDEVKSELAALDRGTVRPLADASGGAEAKPAPSPKPADSRPFAHPFYWAGFILIGDPG
jgi:tetratricopeptide (TPR) repeat protein